MKGDTQSVWENEYIKVIVLGIVQGIAEFLPISSSGHLVILGNLLFGKNGSDATQVSLELNIALHLGTLLSITIVFYKEILLLLKTPRLMLAVFIATLPAGIVGITCKNFIEHHLQVPLVAGCGLLATSFFLLTSYYLTKPFSTNLAKAETDTDGTANRSLMNIGLLEAFLIGCFQAVAIIPGISRSGSTISAGLMLKQPRGLAASFSFLMALPVIGGAALLEMKDILKGEAQFNTPLDILGIGILTSAIVGWISLVWLLSWLRKGKLHHFAYYCAAAGILTLVWFGLIRA